MCANRLFWRKQMFLRLQRDGSTYSQFCTRSRWRRSSSPSSSQSSQSRPAMEWGLWWVLIHYLRISGPKQINFQFCEEYGRCKGYQLRSYTGTPDYYKCLWRCQVYGRIFWIQYNLDNTCPDSMLYRLVRHFLLEHITYFVLKINHLVHEIG